MPDFMPYHDIYTYIYIYIYIYLYVYMYIVSRSTIQFLGTPQNHFEKKIDNGARIPQYVEQNISTCGTI